MHNHLKLITFLLILISGKAYALRPPPAIINQMEVLARVEGALLICTESNEYQKLNGNEALKYSQMSIESDDIIKLIEKKYQDDLAYAAVLMAALDNKDSLDFQQNFFRTYSKKCSSQLLFDSNKMLAEVKKRVNLIIKNK